MHCELLLHDCVPAADVVICLPWKLKKIYAVIWAHDKFTHQNNKMSSYHITLTKVCLCMWVVVETETVPQNSDEKK